MRNSGRRSRMRRTQARSMRWWVVLEAGTGNRWTFIAECGDHGWPVKRCDESTGGALLRVGQSQRPAIPHAWTMFSFWIMCNKSDFHFAACSWTYGSGTVNTREIISSVLFTSFPLFTLLFLSLTHCPLTPVDHVPLLLHRFIDLFRVSAYQVLCLRRQMPERTFPVAILWQLSRGENIVLFNQ